jgi:arylsulfatase A-like enzyme
MIGLFRLVLPADVSRPLFLGDTMIRCMVAIVWVLQAAGVFAAEPAARPNVVLVLTDDLGYADLGCFGSKTIRTPRIDRLAREGVRLTDSYAAACVCSPTRAALITGRYPQKAGFDWVVRYTEKGRGLSTEHPSIARSVKAAGYATGLFGKWHLGYKTEFSPLAHGFEKFFGILAADADYYSHKDALGDPALYEGDHLVDQPGYLTDLITDRAIRFIKENQTRPFFLEVAYNAPHWPFQRPDNPTDIRDKTNYGLENGTRADYVAIVEKLDQCVGQILDKLDELKLAGNTLVIFTNDNGGERLSENTPFFHGKYSLWEGGIRVPAIVRWPGKIKPGTFSSQPNITMDWTASIISAVGAKPQAALDGIDLSPILAEQKPVQERTLFWRLPRPDAKFGQRAVRRGNWKYLYDRECDFLFDLANDPSERSNLARSDPKRVAELKAALDEWEKTLPATK